MTRKQILLAGNPNVGKTTLFNALTGLSAKVSNYPGITVEAKRGTLKLPSGDADIHDLPGTYSLNARSAEEALAFDAIAARGGNPPDAVIVVLDATQLARCAYLLLQCQELGARCVVALTMVDEAKTATPDPAALAKLFECEVVAVTARRRLGLEQLSAAIDRATTLPPKPIWRWEPAANLRAKLDSIPAENDAIGLWAVTNVEPRSGSPDDDELEIGDELRAAALDKTGLDLDAPILARWAWLDREIPKLIKKPVDRSRTQRIDRILMHRVLGFGVFLAVMTVLFMSLFWWAQPLIDQVDGLFGWLGECLRDVLGEGVFTDFLVDGVIGGVGSVMVFLPQILLLFLFLGFLEDCGYLARVAYLMDRIMRSMNLHGRAFVPMLSGFACAVPAVMATRTMERRRDRILTMMVVPLMTCSARLPVYTLVIAALIPGSALTQALLMVGMYLFSVVTALAAAWIMSKTVKPLKAKRLPFFIELPPYRFPRIGDVLRMMWSKSSFFLREAGTVILACSIVLWALLAFPRELPEGSTDYAALIEKAEQAGDDKLKTHYEAKLKGALVANSYGGRIGHAIEPAIKPLGFDWKIGIGIVGAFAAREVFVSTMGIVYSVGEVDAGDDESTKPLREALSDAKKSDGTKAYTPLIGLSLMIFFALACQCMSTLAVVKRETGGWGWPLFLFGYMTVLAWVVSFAVFQIGTLLGF